MELGRESALRIAIESSQREDRVVIGLGGELDLSNADQLEAAIQAALRDKAPHQTLIFDLADLRFMDSSGLAVLIRTAGEGITVRLREASPVIREIVNATGLADIVRVDP
jgi:anti-sigma B factor antagonist